MIVFERCNSTLTTCKTDDEIERWLRYKYIVTIQNRKDFIQYEFGENRINMQSEVNFLPMSFERQDHVRMITRHEATLIDNPFSLTGLETSTETSFVVKKQELRNIPYTNLFWNTITFEMSQTRIEVKRQVYGFVDFLS